MRPEDRDAALLWDMLQASRDAAHVVSGTSLDEFRRDRVKMLALERSMELLGEAARGVSGAFRGRHAEMPWKEMIGLRNILAHEYGRIDHARLYATAIRELPELTATLESLLRDKN